MHIQQFLKDVAAEVATAQRKFPSSDGVMCALTEEVGEVAKAVMEEPWRAVWKEAVQVAAMAARLAVEGDHAMGPIREKRGGDRMPRACPYKGCAAPYANKPPCALCYE